MRSRLDELEPDTVVLLNGLFMFEAITKAICHERGIDVVNYERGFIKETLFFARGRLACFGEIDHFWAEHRETPLTVEQEEELNDYFDDRIHGRRAIEKYWRDVEFDEVPRRTAGRRMSLFTNLTWDSAIIGKEIAFESIQDWLTATIDFFAGRADDELVINARWQVAVKGEDLGKQGELHLDRN